MSLENNSSIFSVQIDFSQSHLIFPTIILWFMAILLVVIAVLKGPAFIADIRSKKRQLRFFEENYDKVRLLGTIVIVPVYFYLMDLVGTLFPNLGMGFLLVSIPFMASISLLYVHDLTRRKAIIIGVNALIAPSIAWFVLGYLFNITLP